jgi:hypothetical protein
VLLVTGGEKAFAPPAASWRAPRTYLHHSPTGSQKYRIMADMEIEEEGSSSQQFPTVEFAEEGDGAKSTKKKKSGGFQSMGKHNFA